MGLFWCKKRQLTPSSDVYAAMFYEFISSLFPVFSSDTTLHNTCRFARIHAVSRWDCQSIFTPTKEKFSRKMKLKCRFYEEKQIQNVLLSAGREEKRKRKRNSKFILQQSWKDSWVSWHVISSPTLLFTPNPKYRVTKSLHLEDGDFSALRRRDCGHDRSLWICVFSWLEGMVNVLVNQFYHVETVLKRLHIKGLSNTAQGLTQFLNFSSSVYFKMNQFIEKTPLIEKMWKVILSTLVTRNLFLEDRLVRNFCFIVSLLYLKTHM